MPSPRLSASSLARIRADQLAVQLGLCTDLENARRRILAGEIWIETRRIGSAGELLPRDALLELRRRSRYVSRGGDKLDGALDALAIQATGRVAVDVGCSTGGFTDCLLQRGAARVFAIDVGYGQFEWKLRHDPRVVLFERTNVRTIDPASLDPRPDLLVADLSFIALRAVLDVLADLIGRKGDLLLLVKPQFELPSGLVSGGVVRDPALHEQALQIVEAEAERLAMTPLGRVESRLRGPKGNHEFFLALRVDQRNSSG